jgi:papain like protease
VAPEVANPPDRVLNVGDSPAREDDDTPAAAMAAGHLSGAEPPDAFDLRAPWWDVGDQGETGSCVGWALADSVLRRQLVGAGRLAEAERLSPRFMWMAAKEMRAKLSEAEGGPGWLPTTFLEQGPVDVKSALDVARRYGIAFEEDLPFHGDLFPGGVEHFYDVAGRNKIAAYYRLDTGDDPAAWFEHWRRWIAQHGPVLVTVLVDKGFGDGVPLLDAFDPETASYLHAAALVGYSGDGFLVRCSWGTTWGRDGYAAATEDYLTQAVAESYGVVV